MKKTLLLLVLSIVFSMNAFAEDKKEDLKELISLMQVEQQVEGKITAMIPMMKQQLARNFEGEKGDQMFKEYMAALIEETKVMTEQLVNKEVVELYDKHFNHKEIKELIKFYKSPIGQKSLDKTQVITEEMMTAMTNNYLPEFQQRLTIRFEEILNEAQ